MFTELDRRIGLAHRRLSIIDTSAGGHQPMTAPDGQVTIVFNGEIYNYQELRRLSDYTFIGESDTEVLLALYRKHGIEMLSRLNGIYAFAIWDSRAGHLFLARDGVGVKPLYYSETSKGFVFASEISALLHMDIDMSLDPEAIRHHLTYLWSPAPRTMFGSVRKLEPGCAMTVVEGRVAKYWRHYAPPLTMEISMTEEAAIEGTRHHLRTAVHRQLVSDVPVGAFLSGGLDSSSVVAFAKQAMPTGRFPCFTIRPPSDDESTEGFVQDFPYASEVARYLDVDLHVVDIDPDVSNRLEHMVYHLDEPQADFAPINVFLISELARQQGVKVLLSGAGGDDIFTGYRRHQLLGFEKYWAPFSRPLGTAAGTLLRQLPPRGPKARRFRKLAEGLSGTPDERVVALFRWLSPLELEMLSGPLLQDSAPGADPLIDSLRALPEGMSGLAKAMHLEVRYFLPDHNLNYTDKMSMAAGVEVRVPFLDPDLMGFAAGIPLHLKQRRGTGKWVLKKAMEPFLPKDVIYRPKVGFGAPVRSWLRGPLKQLVNDNLSPAVISRRGIFDPTAVSDLVARDRRGVIDASYPILSLVCIELWCQQFIDSARRRI